MTRSLVCCLFLALMSTATATRPIDAPGGVKDQCCPSEDAAGDSGTRARRQSEEAEECPNGCTCYRRAVLYAVIQDLLLVVNCSGRGLVEFPRRLPENTEVLDMSKNRLQNLTSLPYMVNIKVLDISGNRIRQLDNHWLFEHVDKLQVLSLADNSITTLQHGTFSGLNSLRRLDLSLNAIKWVETHSFTGLGNLEVLHLENNQMYELKREWLLPMTSLQTLYVSGNTISSLEAGVFGKMPELQHLDISGNVLRNVSEKAFTGLKSLRLLNLTGSSNMREVPTKALQQLSTLDILLLDRLPLSRLRSYVVSGIDVAELSLSYLPRLAVVERAAFHNMTRLKSLQLHDNPNLVYIHPAAFSSLPNLRHLHLHNNGLLAVSSQILSSLPSLADLHLYHNPFHCDCNIYWLREELSLGYPSQYRLKDTPAKLQTQGATSISGTTVREPGENITRTLITEPERVSCFFQSGSSSMALLQLPIEYFSSTCSPTVLPLFSAFINVTIGDDIWLECHGLGIPVPSVSWILPGGREINSTSAKDENTSIEVPDDTLLHIKPVSLTDSGTYGCRAVNSISEDLKTTFVGVQNKPLSISDVRIGNDYITLAWKGAIPRVQMSDFQLYYREAYSNSSAPEDDFSGYEMIQLHGTTHKYMIAGLKPETTYEVCLAYKRIHPVQCSSYTTRRDVEVVMSDGIVRISKSQIGIGFAVALGVVFLLIVLMMVRKARRRKDYQGPVTDEDKASIPLEAVGPTVPSTPLTSSRTALLTNAQI